MRRRSIDGAAEEARVALFGAQLGLSVVADEIASAVQPALTLLTLDDQLSFVVRQTAVGTGLQRGARSAHRVVVAPRRIETGIVRSAHLKQSISTI